MRIEKWCKNCGLQFYEATEKEFCSKCEFLHDKIIRKAMEKLKERGEEE